MAHFSTECPDCGSVLNVAAGFALGAAVHCPLCRVDFLPLTFTAGKEPAPLAPDSYTISPVIQLLASAYDVHVSDHSAIVEDLLEEEIVEDEIIEDDILESESAATGSFEDEIIEEDILEAETGEPSDSDSNSTSQEVRITRTPSHHKRGTGVPLYVHFLGIIGGGFMGLALGYYLLNYFGGSKFDFLEIPLPGVSHTSHHSWRIFSKPLPP